MEAEALQHELLPAGISPFLAWLGLAIGLALWLGSHRWKRRVPAGWEWPAFSARAGIGFLTLLFAAEAGQRFLVYATNWPLWPVLLAGAGLVEAAIALYRLERRTLSRRPGVALTALRVLLILAVIAILCQPVRIFESSRRIERHAVLLLDNSASMQIADNGMTPAEKVRLAEKLSVRAAQRPFALDKAAARLREAQQKLTAQADWLTSFSGIQVSGRSAQTEKQVASFRATLDEALKRVGQEVKALADLAASPLTLSSPPDRTAAGEMQTKLTSEIRPALEEAGRLAKRLSVRDATNLAAQAQATLDAVRRAAAGLNDLDPKLVNVGESLDEAFYRSLPDSAQKEIDRTVGIKRSDLARRLLTHKLRPVDDREADIPSLLERLQKDYGIVAYSFAESPSKIRTDRLLEAAATNGQAAAGSRTGKRSTDIAAALEAAMASVRAEQFAGIVLLSDGRHNAAVPIEPVARKLGLQSVPICPVVFGGGRHPPTDAAIASVQAPDSVYTNDKVFFNVDLKLDGLGGTNVTVSLWDGDALVNSNSVVAVGDAFRKRVQLADVPKTNGLHVYRIAVETGAAEVSTNNNDYTVPVFVSADQIRLLVVEGRPRWEFRYLKNLFSGRDSSVRLQYVVWHPDRIADIPSPPERAASVAGAGSEDAEATRLPKSEADWMAFDVVILGDVAPADLGDENLKILKKFVTERGGALVVIAGPISMPHAYTGSALSDLLPVTVDPSDRPLMNGPEPEFRIALTAEGRESVIMRLADDPEQNATAWDGVPSIAWRHAIRATKDGATVLAYALPRASPEAALVAAAPAIPNEEALARRQRIERDNALIAVQNVALGKVMYLSFDHTWRLRYRRGDLYHHRLWGQILRWATSDKLPAGTAFVRLGTDRPRYGVGTPVRVKARICRADLTPITDAAPDVAVWSGERRLLGKRLQYIANSPGLYGADVGSLPEGRYRVELPTREIRGLPEGQAATVSTEFAVTADVSSEDVELSADRGLLTSLAGLTAGKVFEPADIERVTDKLGPPTVTVKERRQIDLWNSWPFFIVILLVAAAEWALRKKVRLP